MDHLVERRQADSWLSRLLAGTDLLSGRLYVRFFRTSASDRSCSACLLADRLACRRLQRLFDFVVVPEWGFHFRCVAESRMSPGFIDNRRRDDGVAAARTGPTGSHSTGSHLANAVDLGCRPKTRKPPHNFHSH